MMIAFYLFVLFLAAFGILAVNKAPAIRAFYDRPIFGPQPKLLSDATELTSIRLSGVCCLVMAFAFFYFMLTD